MSQEIERKFLVAGNFKDDAVGSYHIIQGYLNSVPGRAVRIRVRDQQGFITIKGSSDKSGLKRFEWEKEIKLEEARQLLEICEPGVIDKTRYLVPCGNHTFEVDEFYGDNQGLVMAEVELAHEEEHFEKPGWLGREVTGDVRYYNAMLKKHPFSQWEKQ